MKIRADYLAMWQRSSLDDSPFQTEGNLDFAIRDFDGDGNEELLTYDMEKKDGDWAVTVSDSRT